MTLDEYQKAAERTAGSVMGRQMLALGGLGLTGEAGEVADYIKKVLFHNHELDEQKLVKELGDVLWYISFICSNLGITLDEVAEANIAKLKARYPDGFDPERSKNREAGA